MNNETQTESKDLDFKQTPSDKVYNGIGIVCSIVAFTMLAIYFCLFFINAPLALNYFMHIFYPFIFIFTAAIFCSFAEFFRNRYLITTISVLIEILCFAAIVTIIVSQIVIYKTAYIIPFIYL